MLTYLEGSMYFNILSGYFFWSYFSFVFVDSPCNSLHIEIWSMNFSLPSCRLFVYSEHDFTLKPLPSLVDVDLRCRVY